ncbi:MAG TPA: APC family permease [Streptosporangiaceae bacterium]|nr:APC family permease [Streptosporangiaceae bacterium]
MEEQGSQYLDDDAYLEELGVQPKLRRGLNLVEQGFFGIAFQGPTAGSILVTSAAFAVGGPAFIWVFPICLVFQTVMALQWGELVSQYPITGGIYQWAKYLGGEWWGWLTAVFYTACVVIIQPLLGVIVNVVLNGLFPSIAFSTKNSIIIAVILTLVAGIVISTSVRLAGLLNGVGVVLELFVLFGATIILLFHTKQPVHIIFKTASVQGHGSYIVPFIVALALELTLLTGFESAGFFSEEVRRSRTDGPRAILMACIGTAIFTGLFAFAMLLATPNISAGMAAGAGWVPQTLHSALGTAGEDTILAAALVALVSTAIANMGAMTRLIFGMSRDRFLPGSAVLGKVSSRTGEPFYTVVLCVLLSFIPILIITKITVVVDAVAGLLLATYLITAGTSLPRRLRRWPDRPAPFRLGKWGLPLTVIGLVWVAFALTVTAWPRDITNPVFGPTRVIWEIGGGLVILAGLAWVVRSRRTVPQAGAAASADADASVTTAEP